MERDGDDSGGQATTHGRLGRVRVAPDDGGEVGEGAAEGEGAAAGAARSDGWTPPAIGLGVIALAVMVIALLIIFWFATRQVPGS